jgi:DNA polymerase-3 subunit delta'
MFEYLFADVIRLKLNQQLKNQDLVFDDLAQIYNLETLFSIYSDFQQKKLMLEQNVQSQLVMDELFIQLMNVHQ